MKLNFRLSVAVLSVAVITSMFGCGSASPGSASGDDSPLVQQAKEEGTVTWYSTCCAPEHMQEIADAFGEKYGIQVEFIKGTSAELLQRYNSERDAGKTVVDVLSHSIVAEFEDPPTENEFQAITDEELPSLADWPEDALHSDVAVTSMIQPFTIAYNTDEVEGDDVPKDWLEAVDSDAAKAGNMVYPDPLATPTNVEMLKMLRDEYGDEILRKIDTVDATPHKSNVTAMQALASGEATIHFGPLPGFVTSMMATGAPVDYVVPPVTTGNINYQGVPTAAPHPSAGLLFLDFLMSREGQALLCKDIGASVLPDIEGAITLGDGYVNPKVEEALAERSDILALVGEK